jgi:RNA polymerase sigma-70 factor (ECF subfamily)
MSISDPNPAPVPAAAGRFATTHWSLIAAARDPTSSQAGVALAALCEAYWYPLYAYIRRQGVAADEAQDLTQEFFARLLEKHWLDGVDQTKGTFRSFLLTACQHFLANERDRARAQKRGGNCKMVSIDFRDAEARYGNEPAHDLTAEKLYARRWALTLLDQVLGRLRETFVRSGRGPLFERLRIFLLGEKQETRYGQVAEELGMTEGAVKVAVHRLRRQYRDLLREEIARTLRDPIYIDEEIRDLFAALAPKKRATAL